MLRTTQCTKLGGHVLQKNRLMGNVDPRTWTPSITPRTTESLTCWTSATWRAGEGRRMGEHYCFHNTLPRFLIVVSSRDLAVIVASMAYNTWFTKLYCKDLRIVSVSFSGTHRSDESLNEVLRCKTNDVFFLH